MKRRASDRSALEQIEWVRSLLAFLLVGSFVGMIPVFVWKTIPTANEQIITYMLGQLSGMAITVLGFFFVNKVGADAMDAKRSENTGKLADAVNKALDSTPGTDSGSDVLKAGDTVTLDPPKVDDPAE